MTTDRQEVSVSNYVRSESDFQMSEYVRNHHCFGALVHSREPYDVMNQVTVRGNRDTLYSFGVFDLASPLTVSLPESAGRYQSLMTASQDHSIEVFYGPGDVTLSADSVGTRYVLAGVRTFMDPNDEDDIAEAHRLQDQVGIVQDDIGILDLPKWDQQQVESVRNTLIEVGALAADSSKMFGRKDDLDPVYWTLGAAMGWGGLPAEDALYGFTFPANNDGTTPYTLTVAEVPVDAFWSVTLYDDQGWIPVNEHNAYSYNGVTAERNADDSVTIHFGGNPDQPNFLPIVEGWNCLFRTYRPQPAILDGTWTYPELKPAE